MMSFLESAFNVRLISVAASLLLGGLGCDATDTEMPDAQSADPTLTSCASIADDVSPAAQESRLDGTYAYEVALSTKVTPTCFVADDGSIVYSLYISLDRERFTKYRRVYPRAEGCGTDFDSGGKIEVLSEGVLRSCGPAYTTADGTFRQAVSLVKRADGSLLRSYTFYGEGPANLLGQELIVSTRTSDVPFEDVPTDMVFARYHRP
jgi:hypothetical protein